MNYENVSVKKGVLEIDIRTATGEICQYKLNIEPIMSVYTLGEFVYLTYTEDEGWEGHTKIDKPVEKNIFGNIEE